MGAEDAGPDHVLEVYSSVGWFSVVVGVGVIVVSPLIKKLMHLDTLTDDNIDVSLGGQREIVEPQVVRRD